MTKQDEVDRNEQIEASRAEATWDGEGGGWAPRPNEDGSVEPLPPSPGPSLSRRVEDRHETSGERHC